MRQRANTATAIAFLAGVAHPQCAQADIVIGPRFSYYFDNSNLRTPDLEGLQDARQSVDTALTQDLRAASGISDLTVLVEDNGSATNSDQIGFPMLGALVNFGDDRDRFTLTGMVGEGSVDIRQISSRTTRITYASTILSEIAVVEASTTDSVERIDLEATWQRRLDERFAIVGGLRYERLDAQGAGAIAIDQTDQVRQFVDATLGANTPPRDFEGARQPARVETSRKLETISGRFGVTAFVPVGDATNVFFNGMAHASYQPESAFETQFLGRNGDIVREEARAISSEVTIGPDFAVGTQIILAENLAVDFRYRAILFFPLSGDFDFSDARANHGVNLGISLRL